MSIIAQSYLIPLISERYGRPLTKLLSQENEINQLRCDYDKVGSGSTCPVLF